MDNAQVTILNYAFCEGMYDGEKAEAYDEGRMLSGLYISQIEAAGLAPGTVCEEYRQGYNIGLRMRGDA